MRSFDPRAVGRLEARAWETYYQRRWFAFLFASVGLVRAAFGFNPLKTLAGAWLVLRANQVWAPYPANDPARARALMARFYRMLPVPDARRAAELEVEWWRVHREHQRGDGGVPSAALVDALANTYAYVYSADGPELRRAAELRARAMDISDAWVEDGAAPGAPRLAEERALLVRSYAALLSGMHR